MSDETKLKINKVFVNRVYLGACVGVILFGSIPVMVGYTIGLVAMALLALDPVRTKIRDRQHREIMEGHERKLDEINAGHAMFMENLDWRYDQIATDELAKRRRGILEDGPA